MTASPVPHALVKTARRENSGLPWSFWVGGGILVAAWAGPLPRLVDDSFAAHMTLHVMVVAIAAPLLAVGLTASRWDPTARAPLLFVAIPASVVELVVVWGWHTPAVHDAAAASPLLFAVEQATFLGAGLLVWLSAFAPDGADGRIRGRAMAGVGALLFTSMHMTLLGALIGLAPRTLFHRLETCIPPLGMTPLEDQHVGGIVMLAVGGISYLAGALVLMSRLLKGEDAAAPVREGGEGSHQPS